MKNFPKAHSSIPAAGFSRIRFLLIFVLISSIFAAVGSLAVGCGKTVDEDAIPPYDGKKIPFPADELSSFVITRSDDSSDTVTDATVELRNALEPVIKLKITTDFVNTRRGEEVPEDIFEILVGSTNRADTVSLSENLRKNDFVIAKTDKHLVITGGSDASTEVAVKYFIDNFVGKDSVSLPEETFFYKYTYPFESLSLNGKNIREYTIVSSDISAGSLAARVANGFCDLTGFEIPCGREADGAAIRLDLSKDLPSDTCVISVNGNDIVLNGADNDTLLCAVKYLFAEIVGKPDGKAASKDASISEKITFDCGSIASMEPVVYSVSVNDSPDDPCAAINAAFERMREDSLMTLAPQVVELSEGIYTFSDSLTLDAFVSGTKYAPLTIRAAKDADVKFTGSVSVDASEAAPVADKEVIARFADQKAAEKILVLDLSPYFEGEIEMPYTNGATTSSAPMTIYWGETPLGYSRWPNKTGNSTDYLRAGNRMEYVDHKTGPITFNFNDASKHAAKYWSEETAKQLCVFGYLANDWANDSLKVAKMDLENNVVTLSSGMYYTPVGGTRFYFYNLLEEIDVPGESFLDTETKKLYFYPYDTEADRIWINTFEKPFLVMDGAKNVVVDGISFVYTRSTAITGTALDTVTFKNCTVAHTSDAAMVLSGKRITIDHCKIYDLWAGGVNISGGDRATLTSGENIISNCEIHDVDRSEKSYKPGIWANSVGLQILNNKIWGNPHLMISIATNDVVIKYNEIFECVTASSDIGAIYFGRNPTILGTEIANNYFHDIGNKYGGVGQHAIFVDDGSIGAWVHDNVFFKSSYDSGAIKSHAAQYYLIENNIFVATPAAFANLSQHWCAGNDTRMPKWLTYMYDEQWYRMTEVPFESEAWHEKYDGTIFANVWKHLSTEVKEKLDGDELSSGEKALLKKQLAPDTTNILRNNVYFALSQTLVNGEIWIQTPAQTENNVEVAKTDFVDYQNRNFALTEEALKKVRETIPDFRNIDMTKIGPDGNN